MGMMLSSALHCEEQRKQGIWRPFVLLNCLYFWSPFPLLSPSAHVKVISLVLKRRTGRGRDGAYRDKWLSKGPEWSGVLGFMPSFVTICQIPPFSTSLICPCLRPTQGVTETSGKVVRFLKPWNGWEKTLSGPQNPRTLDARLSPLIVVALAIATSGEEDLFSPSASWGSCGNQIREDICFFVNNIAIFRYH